MPALAEASPGAECLGGDGIVDGVSTTTAVPAITSHRQAVLVVADDVVGSRASATGS